MIVPMQIRAGRALLDISQADLAEKSGLSKTGVANIEAGKTDPKASTLAAIQRALEAAGVRFIGTTGVELVAQGTPQDCP